MGSFDLGILDQRPFNFEDLKGNITKVAQELDRDRKALRKLKTVFHAVPNSLIDQIKHERSLSTTMHEYAMPSTSDKETSECFSKYDDFIREMMKLQNSYSREMKTTLCDPMDSTVKCLKNIEAIKKDWDHAKNEYERKQRKGMREALEAEHPNLKRCAAEYFKKSQKAESGRGTNLANSLIEFSQRQTEFFTDALNLSKKLQHELEMRQQSISKHQRNDDQTLQRLDEIAKQFGGGSMNESYSVHQNLPQMNSGVGETKKGTVFVKRRQLGLSIIQGFKKRLAHVRDDGYFEIYHNNTMETRINLLTSSVKRDMSDRKVFELTAAEKSKPFIIMGTTEPETENWVEVIQNAKNSLLNKYFEPSVDELTKKILSAVESVQGNDICADCCNRNPTWLSINLGILVCEFCSGVHRDMGVNFSKIRSMNLDKWGTANLLIARNLGNEILNEVYEANIYGVEKPNPSTTSEMRTSFIKQKYIQKRFIQKTIYSEQESSQALESAIRESDMHALLQAYAEGAKPEVVLDSMGGTCLHLAVEYGKLHIIEFLLQNAKDSSNGPVDGRGNTLLHQALEDNCSSKDLLKLIIRKYPDDALKTNYLGKKPADCTNDNEFLSTMRELEGVSDNFKLLNVDYVWHCIKKPLDSDDEGLDDSASASRSRGPSLGQTEVYPSEIPSTDANFLDHSTSSSIHSSPAHAKSVPSRSDSSRSSNKILQYVPQFTNKGNEDVMAQLKKIHMKDIKPQTVPRIALVPDKPSPTTRTRGTTSLKEPKVQLRHNYSSSFKDKRKYASDSDPKRASNYRNSAEIFRNAPKALPRNILPKMDKSFDNHHGVTPIVSIHRDSHEYAEVGVFVDSCSGSSRNSYHSSPNNSLVDEKRKSRSLDSTKRSESNVSRASSFSSRTSRQKPPEPDVPDHPQIPSRVRAIYDCDADDDDELTFVTGELISITGLEEEGWLTGHIESQPHRSGLVPQIFVEILEYR